MMLVTLHAEQVSAWVSSNLPHLSCKVGRDLGARGRVMVFPEANAADRQVITDYAASIEPAPTEAPLPAFGGTRPRLTIYSRNAVSWLATRSWSGATKKADVAALKLAKAKLAPNVIDQAAEEMASTLTKQVGRDREEVCVTHVACGHSKRPDCFACRLAEAVAAKLGFTFRKVFKDRFVAGVSHPKEFSKLDPIEIDAIPAEAVVLVVDDVATSGWHMEEALNVLRDAGVTAMGATWIAGNVE